MMKMRTAALLLALALLTGCAATAPEPTTEAPENAVTVSNVDELIAAVKPGAVLELSEGMFALFQASSYGRETGSDYCRWRETYEGYELEIHDVQGLTLRGTGADKTTLSAEPRYANVLSFRNCGDLTLEDLTAGHTEAPGWCSGGVVYLKDCRNVRLARCTLFGCGTIGVWAESCRDLLVEDADIYECSYNAVSAQDCRDLAVRACRVYRCGVKDGAPALSLFQFFRCDGVEISQAQIHDNAAGMLLCAASSRNMVFVSNDVHDNRFEDVVFSLSDHMVTVDGCALKDNRFLRWAGEIYPMDAEGGTLTDEDLEAMTFREIDPESVRAALPVTAAAEVAPGGEVRVTNVDELLAAIGPERTILLAPGTYDLSQSADYGGYGGEYYFWEQCYDGPGLVVNGAKGLTLRAEDENAAHTLITAEPRYANVIAFRSCEDVTIQNLTLGHNLAPGECAGGVIDLQACSGTTVEGCRLYGCGVSGVNAWGGTALTVRACEIYDCSWCAVYVSGYDGVTLEGLNIHDIPSPSLQVDGCADCLWNGEPMENGMFDVWADGTLRPFEWSTGETGDGSFFRADSEELAFALKVQSVLALGDWEELGRIVSYPFRIYTPQGCYSIPDAQSMDPERLSNLLGAEFRQAVATAALGECRTTAWGSSFAGGAAAFEHVASADGEELRLTAISTLWDLW